MDSFPGKVRETAIQKNCLSTSRGTYQFHYDSMIYTLTGWWFQTVFIFTRIPGEMIQFDEHIFEMGGSTTN